VAEISEEAQEQQYTSLSSSYSSPIAALEVDPDEVSLASVLAKKSPMPFLEADKAGKWVKDVAQKTESDAPPNDLKSSDKAATKAEQIKLSACFLFPYFLKTEDCFWSMGIFMLLYLYFMQQLLVIGVVRGWKIHFQAKSDGMVEVCGTG
ncbi:unnamed protein product, partial [Musa textilis]